MTKKVRTRYAPSPTGFQHIGGVRTALYCYLFARKNKGTFILRIEDTDQKRYVAEAEDYIHETLKWLGIEPDESPIAGGDYGPYRQSERKELYQKNVQNLIDNGFAYYAFDTPEEIEAIRNKYKDQGIISYNAFTRKEMKNSLTLSAEEVKAKLDAGEKYVVRLKVPENEEVIVNDLVRGEVKVNTKEIDDKVLMKGDGMPTYHLANVVDDHNMEITHVVRGEEWLPSTPLHVLLYRAFGWEDTMPAFAHLPLLLKPSGKGKLSKRDGDKLGFPVFPLAWKTEKEQSDGYREMGFLPEAFTNFLAFLGWNPGTEQEIFSIDQLVESFDLSRVSKSGAQFNFEKVKWFNQQYLKDADDDKLADLVLAQKPDTRTEVGAEKVKTLLPLMKDRLVLARDFWEQTNFFFETPSAYDEKTIRKKWKEESPANFEALKTELSNTDWNPEAIEKSVKGFIESKELSFGNIFQPWRLMLSGQTSGPSLFEIAAILGKDESLARMDQGIKVFNEMKAS